MADVRESFTTLEGASQEGLALRSVQEGESVASKNGSLAFGFKDSTGNAIAPALNVSGQLPVVGPLTDTELRATAVPVSGPLTDAQLRATPVPVTFTSVNGNGLGARGTIVGNAALTTIATITLANSKIYDDLDFIVSCFRDARFQVILSDNAVETIISDAICGPGAFSFHGELAHREITSGATGTQLLLIKGLNLNALSDMYASLSVNLTN